jgi:hypothetical protein
MRVTLGRRFKSAGTALKAASVVWV